MAAQKEDGRLGCEARASRETRKKTSEAKVVLKEGGHTVSGGQGEAPPGLFAERLDCGSPETFVGICGQCSLFRRTHIIRAVSKGP